MDYELFLLGLATAPGAEIVTHFIAALSLLLFECKMWLLFKSSAILVASGHSMISNRDAFYGRTTDYVLFLLGLATAPWAEIVTHFIAALSLLLFECKMWFPFQSSAILVVSGHNMISNRDAFYDRTTDYVLFLLGLATAPWAEIVTHFTAALFLVALIAAT